MSSVGIFYLDEDRDKDCSSSVSSSSRDSPTPPNPVTSPTSTQQPSSAAAAPSTLQIPQTSSSPLLPQNQAFGRKSGVFAATPSFPSPLAQAITVPSQSDSSSSSHSSPHASDDENDDSEPTIPALSSATPKLRSDSTISKVPSTSSNSETASPASSRRSLSRPPSPPPPRQALTPGALLISRAKRSGSGSYFGGAGSGASGSKSSPPRPASAQQQKVDHAHRSDNWSPSHSMPGSTSGSSRGTLSDTVNAGGSSPLAFGSPELEPAPELAAPRPISAVPAATAGGERNSNILGLGWVPNWEGPGQQSKAKGKESSWRPPSPKRELASPIPLTTAPRQRRTSEFLRPASIDLRKLPPPSPTTGRLVTSALPTLSSSASMVSPLNPLPSPWSEIPLGQSFSGTDLSSSLTASPGGAAMRLNKVPTSVRLAADLIKTAHCHTPPLQQGETPSSTATVSTPNPSPADSDRLAGVNAMRKHVLGHSSSMPHGSLNPAQSPTQRWSSIDTSDSSLSPQSSMSILSGASAPRPGMAIPGSTSPPSHDLTSGWLDSLAIQQRLQPPRGPGDGMISPPPFPPTPSPVQTVSPASLAGSSSVHDEGSSGHMTPGGFHPSVAPIRTKSAARRSGLAMDLAGVSSTSGDAASHATMTMQSRQAKVQRWRPRNGLGPPPVAFESAGPSRLSASYVDNPGGRWGDRGFPSYHPRSGSSTLPSTAQEPGNLGLSAVESRHRHPSIAGGVSQLAAGAKMEKQVSSTGSIAGIEWVDWYDCYKAYKAEKIRAESSAATTTRRQNSDPIQSSSARVQSVQTSPKRERLEAPSAATLVDSTGLTPVTSRDANSSSTLHPETSTLHSSGSLSFRRRSLSIRSTLSAIDHKMLPSQKRNVLERPRQTSGGSARSSIAGDSQSSALKRKKNLVSKMEGWWSAVKSNFNPDQSGITTPPHRFSGGHNQMPRTPSAPTSRRGSQKGTGAMLDSGLLAPDSGRRVSSASGRSLRGTTSTIELRGSDDGNDTTVTQTSTAHNSPPASSPTLTALQTASLPPPPPAHFDASRDQPRLSLVRRGLESRRNQPSLRLDLEPAALGIPTMERLDSGVVHEPSSRRSDSRSSSFGSGLLSGISRWDHTPGPLSTTTAGSAAKDDKPVAPGAEVTVASVRQHIRQRLTAAKDQCDNTLRRIIATIAAYEEERIATEVMEEGPRRDYFDTFSDSPVMDPADSEDDTTIPPITNFSSRGPSRRGSVSLSTNVLSSPSRRVAMLSSVPTSPRRALSRRRPSIVPRVLARDIQQAARLNVDNPPRSTSSSRSTSRSRSPMPHGRLVSAHPAMEETIEADHQFLAALQELIVLATDVLDTSVDSLLSRPTCCVEVIKKLQKTGQYWDEHEDWPGRDWYVDILMAVAQLGRVLDWWEAEKGFWKFEDDENEPLTFVMRPAVKDTPQFDLEPGMRSIAASPLVLPSAVPTSSSDNALSIPTLPLLDQSPSPQKDSPTVEQTNQAVDDLRILAEQAKSINIVMELSIQGQEILYVNDAIFEVIGREPEEVLDLPIIELLAPADTSHFAEATDRLMEDDGNTVELRFRFEVLDCEEKPEGHEPGPVYIELEGVGMLIREDNEPSHTMWVMKPVTACRVEHITEAVFPRDGNISTECVLCRICEREIVVWFFEKHNETCDAVHRLEAEIAGSDECLSELLHTVTKLSNDLDSIAQDPAQPQLMFYALPDCCIGNNSNDASPQGVEIRKAVKDDIQDVLDILSVARQIETPSVQEDEADLPFNLQRYLSPASEDLLLHLACWHKPTTADRALNVLFTHVEDQLRRKQKAIARMQSTIRYSEKTRHEWEDKVNQMLSDTEESGSESELESADHSHSPTDVQGPPEQVSPGHRKIAPLARLPITQGHPQRPGAVSLASQASVTTATTTATATAAPPTVVPSEAPTPGQHSLSPTVSRTVSPTVSNSPVLHNIVTDLEVIPRVTQSPKPKSADRAGKGHSRRISTAIRDAPVSPRIPSAGLPGSRTQPSIKDFKIIKPISRGAFGSVYLAKKVATGDYYAIKALKKSDMIAKNQITNVKAERTILMNQATSPYVVRLFFSFQSKDYLYLVMEYLNGGDCSSLVKTLGSLPVDWARNYIGELVLGLEYLHARNVAHRDVKPDNLLIDARGHLKLTDFGLSKVGLLNRQIGGPRPPYLKGTSLRSAAVRRASSVSSSDSPLLSPDLIPVVPQSSLSQSYFPHVSESGSADESSGSESIGIVPRHLRTNTMRSSDAGTASTSGTEPPRFVGTPDYLAPESILGGGADDRMVDWWAVGVVLYEFLYGFPPFHAETPEKVFDNVVSRRINWHEDEIDIPPEAHDLMDRLMCTNPAQRLGARGADEVKHHAFFAGVNWDTLTQKPAVFVPDGTDPESTDYFDQRGANNAFQDDEVVSPRSLKPSGGGFLTAEPVVTPGGTEHHHDDTQSDDFGAFTFKNLSVLKEANDDVIRKMRSQTMAQSSQPDLQRPLKPRKSVSRMHLPPSPSTSTSSAASTPSRATAPITPGLTGLHARRPSELNALTRVKSTDDERNRRYSSPSRFRAGSSSSASASERGSSVDFWKQPRPALPEKVQLVLSTAEQANSATAHSLTVLIAEDNPISQKILETLLSRMGCHCVCVRDGPDALAVTGNLKFDVIFLDMHMPFVSGEQVARMIRSTTNPNQNSPIIAATAYDEAITEQGTLFSAVMGKPFSKTDLIRCLQKVGFIVGSTHSTDPVSSVASLPPPSTAAV